MRFLANENVPGPVVRRLRELGHDVVWAKEDFPGAADRALLLVAQDHQRVTVTCDTDFGELAFRSGLPAACESCTRTTNRKNGGPHLRRVC